MSRRRIRRFLPLLLLLALAAVGPARADQLPPLPLPDCVANGLTPDNFTDCEGNVASYADLPDVPRPATGAVGIAISTRAVDFRLDADRGGQSQLITFSFDLPGEMTAPGPNGSTYISAVKIPTGRPRSSRVSGWAAGRRARRSMAEAVTASRWAMATIPCG